MRVLVFLNRISHTSIPFELSVRIAAITNTEIVVVSFYDGDSNNLDFTKSIDDLPIKIRCLNGNSRFDHEAWISFQHELAQGYDLVHTHHNFSGSIARALAKKQGVPVVNTEHRDHSSFSLLQNLVNAPTLPFADYIVSNSQVTEDSFRWYERLLLRDETLEVIYNGVNIEYIENIVNKTSRSDNKGTFRICTVGRMVPVKNQSTLLRAFKSLINRYPHAELILVGDGPLYKRLESLAHDFGITGNIRFTGEVPRYRVYELYSQSDVFVIPSHAEGFCVAAVEAMAAGLPVIASDIPVFHEVIGECGIYADPTRSERFAGELKQLIEDQQYRREKAESCQTRARNSFSLDQTAEEYFKLYERVAE